MSTQKDFTYLVTVTANSVEDARTIMGARLGGDLDLREEGVDDYTVDYSELPDITQVDGYDPPREVINYIEPWVLVPEGMQLPVGSVYMVVWDDGDEPLTGYVTESNSFGPYGADGGPVYTLALDEDHAPY